MVAMVQINGINFDSNDGTERTRRWVQHFRRGALSILLFVVFLSSTSPTTSLAQSNERDIFDLGTATTDRTSHALGVTVAALVKLKLLPKDNIDINAVNTAGSKDNIVRLRQGDLDFAVLNNLDAYDAFHGTGPFVTPGPNPELRLLTNLWTSAFHFIVKSELAPTGTFDDFLNMEGRRIALGSRGDTAFDLARALFDALDVEIEETYSLQDLDAKDAADAFLEGDLDAFLLIDDGQGDEIDAFFEQAGDTATSLSFSDKDIKTANFGGANVWTSVSLPVGTLPGQTDEQTIIGMHNLLGASAQVPEEAIYKITQTIFDNLPFLQEMHSAASSVSLETALDQIALPVHTGASSYYRDVGVAVPEPKPLRISTLSQTAFLTRFGSVQEARTTLSERTFSILGGEVDQTITHLIGELATELDEDGIRLVGITNPKPADNIADVLYARGVDSAVLPLDILDYALDENIYPGLRGKLVYATELFTEDLHLLASDSYNEIGDLVGETVNLGPRDSASAFTVSFLLDKLNIPIEPTYHDHRTALRLLETGELAAVFFLSAKPMPLLDMIEADQGLRLLDIPPLEGKAYRPSTFSAEDYPALLAAGDEIETFGVRTALISYRWRSENPRFAVLENFLSTFFERLPDLQNKTSGHHPKWQEIDPFSEIEGWERSPAANRWLQSQDRQAETPSPPSNGADG
jgi:TRAP transporter TAXI family solute receptor